MKLIKFDGTVGIMSCRKKGEKYVMAIKKGIGCGFGNKIDNSKYKKGQICDLNKCDVVFEFISMAFHQY